jgi:hypothetical protein
MFCSKLSLGFEVLTAVTRKNTFLWVVISCALATLNPSFDGRIYRLHVQYPKASHARYQQKQTAVLLRVRLLIVSAMAY